MKKVFGKLYENLFDKTYKSPSAILNGQFALTLKVFMSRYVSRISNQPLL